MKTYYYENSFEQLADLFFEKSVMKYCINNKENRARLNDINNKMMQLKKECIEAENGNEHNAEIKLIKSLVKIRFFKWSVKNG